MIYNCNIMKNQKREINWLLTNEEMKQPSQHFRMSLYQKYRKHIIIHLETKTPKEKSDYPDISFEGFLLVYFIWNYSGDKYQQVEGNKVGLNYHSFNTLNFNCWLNDDAINSYVKLLNNQAHIKNSAIRIMHSLMGPTFSKKLQEIKMVLEKQGITKETKLFFIVFHKQHWFFLKVFKDSVKVYDSVKKKSEKYLKIQFIKNIVHFLEWFYQRSYSIKVQENYPQQNNQNDCGIFALCGLKDLVRNKKRWNFSSADMDFKRVQISIQLYEGIIHNLS